MSKFSVVTIGGEKSIGLVRAALEGNRFAELAGEIRYASALHLIQSLDPDIVILDCTEFELNPIAALTWLRTLSTQPSVFVLSDRATPVERQLMLELGAIGYLSTDEPELIGQAFFSPVRLRHLLSKPSSGRLIAI